MRPPSSHWISTKLTSTPTSPYSTPASVSIPLQLFLESPLTAFLSFSKHISALKAKFFSRLKALRCISASSWGPSKESLSLLYKAFLRPLLTYTSPGWFPFLSVINITKLEASIARLVAPSLAASHPPLSQFSSLRLFYLPYSHPDSFARSSYERALCLPTSFPISGLTRLEVRPRLFRSFWRAFSFTHTLMLPSTTPREALLACPQSPP